MLWLCLSDYGQGQEGCDRVTVESVAFEHCRRSRQGASYPQSSTEHRHPDHTAVTCISVTNACELRCCAFQLNIVSTAMTWAYVRVVIVVEYAVSGQLSVKVRP